ncbi:hypothetical protein VPH35_104922 [Triticum aestivum]
MPPPGPSPALPPGIGSGRSDSSTSPPVLCCLPPPCQDPPPSHPGVTRQVCRPTLLAASLVGETTSTWLVNAPTLDCAKAQSPDPLPALTRPSTARAGTGLACPDPRLGHFLHKAQRHPVIQPAHCSIVRGRSPWVRPAPAPPLCTSGPASFGPFIFSLVYEFR